MMWEVQNRRDKRQAEEKEEHRVYAMEQERLAPLNGQEQEGGGQHTKDELLDGGEDVDAVCHLELVDLELDPFAEGLEVGRHGCGLGRLPAAASRLTLIGFGGSRFLYRLLVLRACGFVALLVLKRK
jgi:hypothetical protein